MVEAAARARPMSRIRGTTRLVALLGSPVAHSQSPSLQNDAFEALDLDYAYLAFDIGVAQLADAVQALRTLNARGANVTMPLKQAICAHLDRLAPAAELAGAVNTVVNEGGLLTGHNTDGEGYMMSLAQAGVEFVGRSMVIVGAGGASTAVAIEAAMRGVKSIALFNRRDEFYDRAEPRTRVLRERFGCDARMFDLADVGCLRERIAASDILVNGTPIGMEATIGQSAIPDPGFFHAELTVTDLIYVPAETKLIEMARAAGCRTVTGVGMQRFQGARSFELWTGRPMPADPGRPLIAA
jgi:shikimate dehydrogenase